MMSRGAEAVRLCIQLGTLERAVEYLAGVGWPGSGTDLRGVLGPVARIVDRVCLDIDAGETVHPKVGLECYFDGNRQPRTEPRWGVLLDHLVANGLCTPEKREALLAYPGYTDEKTATVPWPAGAPAGLTAARRAVAQHLRSLAPPRQDLLPAGRTAGGQGVPRGEPPLAHAHAPALNTRSTDGHGACRPCSDGDAMLPSLALVCNGATPLQAFQPVSISGLFLAD